MAKKQITRDVTEDPRYHDSQPQGHQRCGKDGHYCHRCGQHGQIEGYFHRCAEFCGHRPPIQSV